MAYILLFLLIVIVAPLVSGMYKIWSFRRNVRRFMEDPFGQGASASRTKNRRRESERPVRRKKKIPRDVGEYVAFTEYESHTVYKERSTGRTVRTENQITDVEWVDIE